MVKRSEQNLLKIIAINLFYPLLYHQRVKTRAASQEGYGNALFVLFAKSLLLVSSQAALGRPLKTSFSGLQNAVTSTTSLDLGDPNNLPDASGGTSGE